jgi:hypothetical protein
MGCITRLGCLFMLVVLAAIGWYTRDKWLARVDLHRTHVAATAPRERWQPLSDEARDTARAALTRLGQPRGQVFETLSPSAVASYIYGEATKRLPDAADSVEAMVSADKLSVRAVVSLSNLGSTITDAVGIVHERERVELTGTLNVFQPGVAEFAVSEVRIHGLPIPKGMIATLIDRFEPGRRPTGMDANSLPLPIPRYIGDIRVANGKITLYKTVR